MHYKNIQFKCFLNSFMKKLSDIYRLILEEEKPPEEIVDDLPDIGDYFEPEPIDPRIRPGPLPYDPITNPRVPPIPAWFGGTITQWIRYLTILAPWLFFTQQAGGGLGNGGYGWYGNDDQGWIPMPPPTNWQGPDIEWYRDILGIKPSEFPGLGLQFDREGNEIRDDISDAPVTPTRPDPPPPPSDPNIVDENGYLLPDYAYKWNKQRQRYEIVPRPPNIINLPSYYYDVNTGRWVVYVPEPVSQNPPTVDQPKPVPVQLPATPTRYY
jgi:hypothetical protein